MLFKNTNIEERLSDLKRKSTEAILLNEVYSILHQDQLREQEIVDRLGKKSCSVVNLFNFDLLETERIYHLDQIKKICVDYRLRFLDSSYFKGEIPETAVEEIKTLEEAHQIELRGFKILAPSKLFRLEDKDDPLLFAPIGNGYFYLIHKWGNDLHPLRRIFAWPFKNVMNLGLMVVLMSYLVTLLIPEGLFSKSSSSTEFWIIFFFMFKF